MTTAAVLTQQFTNIVTALEDHATQLGVFESVNGHEPVGAPASGVTAGLWLSAGRPASRQSGLASTTMLLLVTVRFYVPAAQQPYDSVDPALYTALAALMAAYSGDFDLGGLVKEIDLLGQSGAALSFTTGWVDFDGAKFRIADLTVPLIINDVFDQAG